MKVSLVIMAAGLGSRYGGSKQVDGIGPHNEILMEYSIYDALRADTADHFDFDGFLASCDTIVMGRKAYEDCLSSLPEAAEKRFLVASRTPRAPEGRVVFLSADVVAEVLALKDRPGKHIWLFGGGELASDFIRADAVDRYIVGILPVIRGKGRRLFQEGIPPVELHLDRCTVSDGIPILEYSRRGR